MAVLLIGTLDTKGSRVRSSSATCCSRPGVATLVIDAGVLGSRRPSRPTLPREQVFAAAGTSLAAVQQAGDRGQAIEAAARGAAQICRRSACARARSTACSAWAARPAPPSAPRPCGPCRSACRSSWSARSPAARCEPYVGVRDILMMHSVVDISGLNRISRIVLTNAAHAMIGMVQQAQAHGTPVRRRRQAARHRDHVRRHHALRRGGAASVWSSAATKCWSFTPPAPAA